MSKKKQLTEIIETLLFQRRLIISDDNVVLKEEMLAHCRDAKDKIVKKRDDTVDALRCLVFYKIAEGFGEEDIISDGEDSEGPDENELYEDEGEWLTYLSQ